MSGDIGRGATKESIAFAVQLAKATERPPGLYTFELLVLLFSVIHNFSLPIYRFENIVLQSLKF